MCMVTLRGAHMCAFTHTHTGVGRDRQTETKGGGREGERDMKNQAGYIKMIKTTT